MIDPNIPNKLSPKTIYRIVSRVLYTYMSIQYVDMIAGLPDAYPAHQLQYQWQSAVAVSFEPGMTLSQFDLMGSPQRNFTFTRREGNFLRAFPPLGKWLGFNQGRSPGKPLFPGVPF